MVRHSCNERVSMGHLELENGMGIEFNCLQG
jgi:hypothetical protein